MNNHLQNRAAWITGILALLAPILGAIATHILAQGRGGNAGGHTIEGNNSSMVIIEDSDGVEVIIDRDPSQSEKTEVPKSTDTQIPKPSPSVQPTITPTTESRVTPTLLPATVIVYEEDFDDAQEFIDYWDSWYFSKTPLNQNGFLGEFNNHELRLKLSGLEPHSVVNVGFDLLINKTWDGNDPDYGPDEFFIFIDDDPVKYYHTTFSNIDGHGGVKYLQSYPLQWSDRQLLSYEPYTGATEVNSNGFKYFGEPIDATYRIELPIYHSKEHITIIFKGKLVEPFEPSSIENESWGIDNILVSIQ